MSFSFPTEQHLQLQQISGKNEMAKGEEEKKKKKSPPPAVLNYLFYIVFIVYSF
jgi:hypothetical protein